MKIGNNPAHPIIITWDQRCNADWRTDVQTDGITIRQQFAMAAMQGMLADPNCDILERVTDNAIIVADLLLKKELETREGEN